jgi:hypothetical protein
MYTSLNRITALNASFPLIVTVLFVPTKWQRFTNKENKLLKSGLPVVALETNGGQSPDSSSIKSF